MEFHSDEDFDLPQRGAFYLADLLMFSRTHNTAAAEAHWTNMVWPALQALPAILEKVPSSWIAASNGARQIRPSLGAMH